MFLEKSKAMNGTVTSMTKDHMLSTMGRAFKNSNRVSLNQSQTQSQNSMTVLNGGQSLLLKHRNFEVPRLTVDDNRSEHGD